MKAVIFAYHNIGIAGLEALTKHGYELAAIFTHEDDPNENCWFGSICQWAEQRKIPVYTTEEINSPEWIERIANLKPEIIFSFYYRRMIDNEIISLPKIGAFNLHGSLLPSYRGRCPVNWVLIKGEEQTGVTLHYMIEKPDAGDIVGQKAVAIDFADTAGTLYDKLCQATSMLLDDLLPLMKKGQIPRSKQNLAAGSYYGGRKPEDGHINWHKSAGEIYNLIRAVTQPYPGAFGLLENGEKLLVWWGQPEESSNNDLPGTVNIRQEAVLVQTGENAIKLMDIEAAGKRMCGNEIGNYFRDGKVTKLK